MECLNCKSDVSDLVNYDHLTDDYITCPKCGCKMTVEYEESYNEETFEEDEYFWVQLYKE